MDTDKFLDEVRTQYTIIKGKYERLTIVEVPFVENDVKTVVLSMLPYIFRAIEMVAKDFPGLTSDQKREVTIKLLNELIDIPYIPNWLESSVIGMTVDVVIHTLNEFFGETWLNKVELR